MSRPNPNSASDDGSDRPTTPGLGDDPRATLPEPLPPVRVPAEFNRTIPMGSAALTDWMASAPRRNSEAPGAGQSGVHPLGPHLGASEPPAANPVTKSDRVLAKGRTLHSFGAAPPPTIETDDKRWIGQDVEPAVGPSVSPSVSPNVATGFNTTQRGFTSAPPGNPSPHKPTLPSITPPQHMNLASTVRVMSVPPPAGSVPPPAPSHAAPPIVPSQTIKVSPEIAIAARAPEVTRPSSTAATPETVVPTPITSRPPPPLPLPTATSTPPAVTAQPAPKPRWDNLRPQVSAWSTTRLLTVAMFVALAAIAVLIVSTTPSSAPTAPAAVVAGEAAAPVAALPSTEIVTNPAGAEIVLRGALVANSPARVIRPSYESLYLVRLRGYQPQLVALAPHSPDTIRIDLQPLSGSQPTQSGAQPASAVAPTQETP